MLSDVRWYPPGPRLRLPPALLVLLVFGLQRMVHGVILTPPYFNLAEGRRVTASATCGVDTEGPELFCKLVGANAESHMTENIVIQGQVCDYCDPSQPDKMHPPEFAVDGMETWWQSPPLSRGMKYNEVNLTIDLGQEFHVAYVYIRMGISPRPGLWVLEKSSDYGKTYTPWQYFSDSLADCETHFGKESLEPITRDDSVICSTEYSKIVPLEGGEIPISLLNNRPSANMYFNSSVLQEWTRATNVRLRLLRTKNLLGHLMSVARQDSTVTRRYFYSIKDISIGGRCMCNGHADTCDIQDPQDPKKLLCRCQHNTCGPQCATCCPGFEQKAWRISKASKKFECEPCNCFNHTTECQYDPEVDARGESLDIHGRFEGGGVCKNCQHNTEGINCNRCKPTFYRPHGKQWHDIDVCQPCQCDYFYSTGNCEEGTGRCECRKEFTAPNCDACSYGYFGYPDCRPCECNLNGTRGHHCEARGGQCPCKHNYAGIYCNQCADTFYGEECLACQCNEIGSLSQNCNQATGNCSCRSNYRGRTCDQCEHGYYNYPNCTYCNCDVSGTVSEVCNKTTGRCMCREGYGGPRCDQCLPGYFGYPECRPCACSEVGSASQLCDTTGKCPCLSNFAGRTCDQCSPGYYKYPECLACNCDTNGANGVSCDSDGLCQCRHNFDGAKCDACKEGFYNYPNCEDCNCNPAGVAAAFAGCGSVPAGELCECKARVDGRICDRCRPLYWNLQAANPEGCEPCSCHVPGVVGALGECDAVTGQCVCKPSAGGQRCAECQDGTYDLRADDLFGCKDCDCDIGGAVHGVCDKDTGMCHCQARIAGRTCREPLQTHYFPTLYQLKYEAEEARTPLGSQVRFAFDERQFPGYSWRGYAVFTTLLQNEIVHNVTIAKPSLYRMVLSYVNPNAETVTGQVTIVPDNPSDIEQRFEVQFRPTGRVPALVTVAGPHGTTPSPLVMNPGRWAVSLRVKNSLYLDYFVLLPAAFYEATILSRSVQSACRVGQHGLCRHYAYPSLTQFDAAHGDGGFITKGDIRESLTNYFMNEQQLKELGEDALPILGGEQSTFSMNLTVTKPGRYVILLVYATPAELAEEQPATHVVRLTTSGGEQLRVHLPPCPYTALCRQAVVDESRRIAYLDFPSNYNTVTLSVDGNAVVGVKALVAVPATSWSLDYIRPRSVCVRRDGRCVHAHFPIAPDSKKVKFELGNEDRVAQVRPINIHDNTTNLIFLDHQDAMVDIKSKVPHPGYYVFVVHYYQPDYPEFDMDVLIQNGKFYEAKLPVQHCPSTSGCRATISEESGNTRFYLTENFVLTLKEPNHKSVWLEYVLVVPAELYSEHVLSEEQLDQTGEFISTCGGNHFHISTDTEGFCRDAVFSLTADYNNGALPCQCDYFGSLSFECENFGGQCPCKPNVIGRKCEACRPGYFGFPDCKPCNCPSTALCEPETGQCICPPRVVGEMCDQCAAYTFGFDQIIGCEECNCNPLGVLRDLQCNLLNGSCTCKPHVVGRTCDHCQPGHYMFPYCEECRCDERGTILDICDQHSARCSCKPNVQGAECDQCVDGTYNLQESNEDGCTKCFCFGKTTRCISSNLYRNHMLDMSNWTLLAIVEGNNISVVQLSDASVEPLDSSAIGADLTLPESAGRTVYFGAPEAYLGPRLTAYGGFLNYTVFYTSMGNGSAVSGADVVLLGSDIYLLYDALEQPAASLEYEAAVELIETNFVLANGLPANREHLMTVLQDLRAIYIRATYWESGVTTRLSDVTLDVASEEAPWPDASLATSVERCQCPPNYRGLSCEECAPGHWRAGPGYCAPCQCNGHSDECDVETGECLDCRHNTRGAHCEQCAVGYHGNALQGTPMDCLICACPMPVTSNNFATGCQLSSDGDEISCDCLPGYYGARCESCAAGYYGRPEVLGEQCAPCSCSGNINPAEPGACDSVTGECLRCLNNTFGEACSLCAPGYYGDAIILKDCQTCACDPLGTERCDSYSGRCECLPNVAGEKCDACLENHYGFTSGQGCRACECAPASESAQCDDASGQCRCRGGVTGRTCDRCAAGFWDYTPQGCVSCGCNTNFSLGLGCNARTGQCECLPGVIGEKCDHCPFRWVFVQEQGCHECDSCTHDLLDTTNELRALLDPVVAEFDAVASGYFTSRRLTYINQTYMELKPLVAQLEMHNGSDVLQPVRQRLEASEVDSRNLNRRANFSAESGASVAPKAAELKKQALEMQEAVWAAAAGAERTVFELDGLTFESDEGPRIDQVLAEAEQLVAEIRAYNLSGREQDALAQLERARELLDDVQQFQFPIDEHTSQWEHMKADLHLFGLKLDDMMNHTLHVNNRLDEAEALRAKLKDNKVYDKVNLIEQDSASADADLKKTHAYLRNASQLLLAAHRTKNQLADGVEEFGELMADFNNTLISPERHDELADLVDEALERAHNLTRRAEVLDHILSDTRNISGDAVGAANAYRDIVTATESAKQAADEALAAAETTNELLDGLEDKSIESAKNATELFEEANELLLYAVADLTPQLELAADEIMKIDKLSNRSENEYKKIVDAMNRLGDQNFVDLSEEAIIISQVADEKAQGALENIASISERVEKDLEKATQLQHDSEHTKNDIEQAQKQLSTINTILPNITTLIDELGPQQDQLSSRFTDIGDKIKKLNHQISRARELANRVKVGVTFYPNTTLELKKPPNLADQTTSTHASVYFNTEKKKGFVFYLGNEIGSKLRRTKSDDYMALEIENGYPVLTMDIGNGPERIISNKYVSDGQWYQAVIDRTGPNVRLTIREETDGRRVIDHTKEEVLEGINTIFNLDQNQSRLFVGGYPASFNIQPNVQYSSFEGKMEDLVIGDRNVGLWNFVDGEQNNVGAEARNRLLTVQPSTGYRFDGHGYAVLDARPHSLRSRTEIRLQFKTTDPEGLLFLAGDQSHGTYMSIELREGRVLYQYDLGTGAVSIWSTRTTNDGKWHEVKASRDAKKGVLEVDMDEPLNGEAHGSSKVVHVTDHMFFGGYPLEHTFDAVTNLDFDGCIDDVQIMSTPIDLSQNLKTFGVLPGCPVKFADLVSFESDEPGYILQPNVSSANAFKVSLKFKTRSPNGVIFYATDHAQTAAVSLALVNGTLVLISQKQELQTSALTKYNDGEWHVVTVTHNDNELRLDIDDWEALPSDSAPPPLHIMYGEMFIGGLREGYQPPRGTIRTTTAFAGCIADATLNGMIINFANTTDKAGEILGRCVLDLSDPTDYPSLHELPSVAKEPESTWIEPPTTTEPPVISTNKPIRGDGGWDEAKEEDESETEPVDVAVPTTTIKVQTEPPIITTTEAIIEEHEVTEETTPLPTQPPEIITTPPQPEGEVGRVPEVPETPPVERCALPMEPAESANSEAGWRFGTRLASRLEFPQSRGRYKHQYDFSIQFRTTAEDGLIFYVADSKHMHFVALYLVKGKLKYVFNCGVGPVLLESEQKYDDGLWHRAVFSRNQTDGKLVVDERLVGSGHSDTPTSRHLNITPPYYLGAVPPDFVTDVQVNLKTYSQFVGCLRNFQMNGKPMQNPQILDAQPCSDTTETGMYFGAAGGYLKLKERFKVGAQIDIQMDIKPRNVSGLIMFVQGKRDFLVLQMVDGVIKFTVDNGKGPIEAAFNPPTKHYFCDGRWHNIQAIKSKNVVSLAVDKTFADAGLGQSHSTDTKFGLFLGGHAHLSTKRLRGVQSRSSFVGCIRDVQINNEKTPISLEMAGGDVSVGVCPTN